MDAPGARLYASTRGRKVARRPNVRGSSMRLAVMSVALAALIVFSRPAQAVVGGSAADATVAQSLVMVLAEGGVACSGIVVAPQVVLTAGHCLPKGRQIRVYAPAAGEGTRPPHLITPAAVAVHPGYVPNAPATRQRSIDLALIRLPEALPAAYGPADLSSAPVPGAGATVTVAGDGLGSESDPRSGGKARAARLGVVEPYGRSSILLWAAPMEGPAGACEGDSGGSMLGASGAVIAVIAFAEGAGSQRCGKLTQGVLVAPQRAFIDTTLGKWGAATHWNDH
jgi:hypothetical protein